MTPYDAGFIAALWGVPSWLNPWPFFLIGLHEAWDTGHSDARRGWRPRSSRPRLVLLG